MPNLDKEIDRIINGVYARGQLSGVDNNKPLINDWKQELKKFIQTREKEMLEFVIGEDDKGEFWVVFKALSEDSVRGWYDGRKRLRKEARQRAKEWRGR